MSKKKSDPQESSSENRQTWDEISKKIFGPVEHCRQGTSLQDIKLQRLEV